MRSGLGSQLAAVLRPASAGYLAIVVTLVLAAAAPMLLGWTPTVVGSGSMQPTIRPGDVLVSAPVAPRTVRPGQVVLVDDPTRPGQLLSHRVFRVRPDGSLVTRGDANGVADSTPVAWQHVHAVGRVVVPRIGVPVLWLRQRDPRVLAFLAVTVAAVVLLSSPSRTGEHRTAR